MRKRPSNLVVEMLLGFVLLAAAFTSGGIPGEEDILEHLKMDAQILGLPSPVPASKVFDFSLQREANQELGIR